MLGKKTGGRKKGSRNKVNMQREAEIAASGMTPLEYMLSIVRDPLKDEKTRCDMAKAAAPYCHPHLQAIQHTGANGGPIEQVHVIERHIVDTEDTDGEGVLAAATPSEV